jgi:MOSC domain-containing protein YiiM
MRCCQRSDASSVSGVAAVANAKAGGETAKASAKGMPRSNRLCDIEAMPISNKRSLASLMQSFPRRGRVQWIGLRPAKRAPVVSVDTARALTGGGLDGDHYGGRSGNRGITLVQAEHLDVIASLTGVEKVAPATLRRNLVVSEINLAALKGRRFCIGDVVLEGTGLAHPCSRMEEALGPGGYNAMRGHGGLCARVLRGGMLRVGDAVVAEGLVPCG